MLTLAFILLTGLASGADWNHVTKDNWPTLFPEYCAGSAQSPINLDSKIAVTPSTDPGAIKFSGYDSQNKASIAAGSHGPVFSFDTFTPTISGGRLPSGDTFQFLSLHWHWGSDSSKGSEHTIDGKQFPLEIHIIHWNRKYGSVLEALAYSDGLAVLGFMYEVTSADNGNLAPILSAIPVQARKNRKNQKNKKVRQGKQGNVNFCDLCEGEFVFAPFCADSCSSDHASVIAELPGTFSLNQFLPSTGAGDSYYYYQGGLTTPMCNEIVLWTNFVTKNTISESQLAMLRALKDGAGTGTSIVDNYRDPQPLNGRTLNLRSGTAAATTSDVSALTIGAAIGAIVMYFALSSELLSSLFAPAQSRSYGEYNNPVPHGFNENYGK